MIGCIGDETDQNNSESPFCNFFFFLINHAAAAEGLNGVVALTVDGKCFFPIFTVDC